MKRLLLLLALAGAIAAIAIPTASTAVRVLQLGAPSSWNLRTTFGGPSRRTCDRCTRSSPSETAPAARRSGRLERGYRPQ